MLHLSFTDGIFIARCDFASRGIPKEAGFRFDSDRRFWYTENPGKASALREYADPLAEKLISRLTIRNSPWSGRLPHPKGLKPYGYQKDPAARFALSRSRSYLALAPRLGKSIVSALVINALETPSVFIAPPFLTRNIEAEFRRWLTGSPRIVRLDTNEAPIEEPDVLIVPDSLIHRPEVQREILDQARFARLIGKEALLITDEAHRYKTGDALRTRALLGDEKSDGLIRWFPRQVYLSGTPMPNRPIELFPILSKVAPETIDFMNYTEYGLRYCAGKEMKDVCPRCHGVETKRNSCYYCRGKGAFSNGFDFSGASNLGELQSRVHGTFMLRMKKVKGLPPKSEELVIIGERPAKLIKLESRLLAEHSPEDLIAGQVSSDHVATYRRELGLFKMKSSIDFIRSLLEEYGEKILIFAYHKEVIATLAERLSRFRPLVITGEVPNEKRREIEQTFQREERPFIGNYLASGLGLTLPAKRVLFVEYSWVPTENDQASDRARVVGDSGEVFVQYLVYENSIDRKVMETNLRKRKITSYL